LLFFCRRTDLSPDSRLHRHHPEAAAAAGEVRRGRERRGGHGGDLHLTGQGHGDPRPPAHPQEGQTGLFGQAWPPQELGR
jgi:hypothetical protein